ncbi:MAG: response regulator [bacterium]|nr:response regulator [bacterium]
MKKTILVVDDNDEIRSFLKKVLTSNNFKIVEASDGEQALENVEKYLPDLVLLDFGLPKVTGETVCVKIKKDHPEIIVIALTEKNQSSDVIHGLQIGADDYIGKPFVAEELIARIDARLKTTANGHPQPLEPLAQELEFRTIILRESIALIIIRLISTEALFGFSLFLLSILSSYTHSYLNISYISTLYFIVFLGAFLINVSVVFSIAIKWATEYTEISKEGVIKHNGIFHKKEQKYACNFVEGAKLDQSLMGLLFNYGTIELYDPALKEQVYLLNITSPKKYSEIIQKIVSKEKTQPIPFVTQKIT